MTRPAGIDTAPTPRLRTALATKIAASKPSVIAGAFTVAAPLQQRELQALDRWRCRNDRGKALLP